jgi:phosphonate transport system substrate-binding protein
MSKAFGSQRIVVLVLLFLAGMCPSMADSGEPLRLGIFPRYNYTETIKSFTPLAEQLARTLGRRVEIETASDFSTFWQAVAARRYDLVHFNQYHYIKAHRELHYEVIARNREGGSDTIKGALLVRRDSGIERLTDLKGKRILFGGGRDAMQAYILTTYLLRRAGLKPGDYIELFAVNPPNAVIATYQKHADAAGAGDRVLVMPVVAERIDTKEMKLLAMSEAVAHMPWAVKAELDPALRQRIGAALLALGDSEPGRAVLAAAKLTGFAATRDADYDPLRRIVFEVTGERY